MMPNPALFDLLGLGGGQSQPEPQSYGLPGATLPTTYSGPGGQPAQELGFVDRIVRSLVGEVGADRYQNLPPEAENRAYADARRNLAYTLGLAATAGNYQEMARALVGGIPKAHDAFEKRLDREFDYFNKQEDREFTLGQREYQTGQQERNLREQGDEDSVRSANKEKLKADGAKWRADFNKLLEDPDITSKPGLAESLARNFDFLLRSAEMTGSEEALQRLQNFLLEAAKAAGASEEEMLKLDRAARGEGYADQAERAADERDGRVLRRRADQLTVGRGEREAREAAEADAIAKRYESGELKPPPGQIYDPLTKSLKVDYSYRFDGEDKVDVKRDTEAEKALFKSPLIRELVSMPDAKVDEDAYADLLRVGMPGVVVGEPLSKDAHDALIAFWGGDSNAIEAYKMYVQGGGKPGGFLAALRQLKAGGVR